MASQMVILCRTRTLIRTLKQNSGFRTITTFPSLSQEPQLAEPGTANPATPLPPNPASGSPLYNENWRSPIANPSMTQSVIPLDFLRQSPTSRVHSLAQTLDAKGLMDMFADWTASQNWSDVKQLFEFWVRSLDKSGKPNKPDVRLFNYYLTANLMIGASAGELLDLVAQMDDYAIKPNTASFNLVLKSDRIDEAFKYTDLALKSGYTLSVKVFTDCVRVCVNKGRLDALLMIIDRCKSMDQNKALCPPWVWCNFIADVALQEDNSKLVYHSLEFMAKWIARGEQARPPVWLSVDEGLLVSALGTAARTYDSDLLDASWAILRRSLRQKKAPNPEAYLTKIHALASLGNLRRAFSTLQEYETVYGNSQTEVEEELFSPFTSLYPLVVACSKKGFETLDSVYFQLENLSRADPPYKSVAALNCIILGCANIWDLDRAYQTFEAIGSSFGLNPDIHSYNALMKAFGKLKKTFEATKVFDHMLSLGIKPNATSYALLVDAHLINRDQKAALSVLDDMVNAGFEPSKETLRKVRRRCIREMDYESNDRVQSLAVKHKVRMGNENRREMLFNLQYSTEYAAS
ncbi:hypothetical protein TIFTF001_011198 [Ficus carica]|uniref:Pentatricopeptide repeat-containing protein n=1 Tax=Ficus carica TaxID=3494 RepID=A0AA88AA21_FICCA|nr:hypothetical protein TIFTF001_011198 [Ficus carica]